VERRGPQPRSVADHPASDGTPREDSPPATLFRTPVSGRHDRRVVLYTLTRSLTTVALLLVLYYELPLDRGFGWATGGLLLGSLVLIGAVVAWQVRSVLRSRYPALRAMETLSLTLPLFLLLFASAYVILSTSDPQAFSEKLTRTDILYFVVTVFATVGFGDITPVSEVARVLTTVQMVADLLVIGLVVRAMLVAVQRAQTRALLTPDAGVPAPRGAGDSSQEPGADGTAPVTSAEPEPSRGRTRPR